MYTKYLKEADELDQEIMDTYLKENPDAQDTETGYYGQYYTEWDDLLNELWGILKETLPANDFDQLKNEQINWVKQKEKNFKELPDETASSRAAGMDFLTFETKDRVYYLIENFFK